LAAERLVVPWGELRPNDYAFRGWARGGEGVMLLAGCVYENARESWKLRCLLVLIDSCLEKVQGLEFLGLSFAGLRYRDALHELGGWFGWLRRFSHELADNVSFAELDPVRLRESLEVLPRYFLGRRAVGFPIGRGEAVLPRVRLPREIRLGSRDVWVQEMAIEIRLGEFTNEEIGKEMAALAELLRGDAVAEPQRRGKGKESETLSLLDALSAMRLASHYPKTLPLPSVLPRREKRNRPQGEGTAVSLFNEVRLGAIAPGSARRKILGEVGHNEFDRYAARGRKQFRVMFPFGESAANALSWAQRHSA
jgi:hypothetical protein